MLKYELKYTDGTTIVKEFEAREEASWFFQNEGDHLVEIHLMEDDNDTENS